MEDEKKRILESQQSTQKRYGRTDRPRVDPGIVRINQSSGIVKVGKSPQQPAPVPSLTMLEKKSNPYLQGKPTPSPGTTSAKQHIITLAATKQTKQNIQPMKKLAEQPKQTPSSTVSSMHGTSKPVNRPPNSTMRPQQPGMPQKPRVNEQAPVQRPSNSQTNQVQNKNRPERPLQQTLKPILDPKSLQMQTLKYAKVPPIGSQLQKTGATFTMAGKVGVQRPLVKRPEHLMAKIIDKKELLPKEFQRIAPNGIHKNKVSDVHKYNTMKSAQNQAKIVKPTNFVAAPVSLKLNEQAPTEIVKPKIQQDGTRVEQKPKIIMQQAQIIQIKAGQQSDSVMIKEKVKSSLAPVLNVVRDVAETQGDKQQQIILDEDMADQADEKSVDESEHESDQEMQDNDAKEQDPQYIGQAIHSKTQVAQRAQVLSSGHQVQTEKNLVINIDMPQTKDKEDVDQQKILSEQPKEKDQVLPKTAQEKSQNGRQQAELAPRFSDQKSGQVPNLLHPKFGKKIAASNVPAENPPQNYLAQDQLVQSNMQNQQQPMLQVNNQQSMPVQNSYIEDMQSKQIQFQQQLIFQLYQAYIQQRFYNEQIHQQLSMQSMQAQLNNAQGNNNFQAQNLGMNPQNGQIPSYLPFNTLPSAMPQQFIPMNSQPLILQPGAAPGMIPQLKPFNGTQMPGMMEMMNRFGQQNMGDSQGMSQPGHQINQDSNRMVHNAMIQQQMLYPNQQPQQFQMQQMAQQMQQPLQQQPSSPNDPPIVAQHQNQKPESLLKQPDLAQPAPPTGQHQLLNTNQSMDMQMHVQENFDNSDLAKPFNSDLAKPYNSDLAKPYNSDLAKPFSMKPLPQDHQMPTGVQSQHKVNQNASEETKLIAPLPVSQILSSQSPINRVSQPQSLAPLNLTEQIKAPSSQQNQPFLQPIKELINSEKKPNLMPPSSVVDNSDLRPQFNTNPPDLLPKQQSPDRPDPQPQARPLEQPKEQEKEAPKNANTAQEAKPNFTQSVQNEQPIRPLKPIASVQQQVTPGQDKGKIENYLPQQQPNVLNRGPSVPLSQCLVGKEVFFDVHVDQQFPNIFREKNIKQPFSMFRIKTKIDAKASQLSNTLIERLNAVAKKDPQIANLNIDKRHINLYFHCDKGDRWWFENTQRVADIINSGFWHPNSIIKSEKGKSAKRIYFVICKTC